MAQFFIDKNNKIPLYLQLKDQIKYFISTGSLAAEDQLPPVKVLAKTLGINFLTVRKAYKELEASGLIDVRHGEGTFISSNGLKTSAETAGDDQSDIRKRFNGEASQLVELYSQRGLDFSDIRTILDEAITGIERRKTAPIVVFTECNNFQIQQISKIIEDEIKLKVTPILIEDLAAEIPLLLESDRNVNIVTTGFHVNEVREVVGNLPIQIDFLITNLDPETRRHLESYGEQAKYSFICRDKESAVLYKDLLKAELGFRDIDLRSCTIFDKEVVTDILASSDIVLVSPPVFEDIRLIAPADKAIYNVFERVDPMSLKVIKERILNKNMFSLIQR